jgi:hypothetical protein
MVLLSMFHLEMMEDNLEMMEDDLEIIYQKCQENIQKDATVQMRNPIVGQLCTDPVLVLVWVKMSANPM